MSHDATNIITKHHTKMSDVFTRKVQIGNETSLRSRHFSLVHITESVRQARETFFGNRSQDSASITEIVIRRLMANTGTTCNFTHRNRISTVRFNDCNGGIEHETANIAMLLGRGRNHGLTVQLDSVKYND
jgi:hypothetical protein